MRMLDRLSIYDAMYALAADDGREQELFGSCAPLAREAFRRSLVKEGFPLVWFEVPLAGEPRFDLHVALSREMLREGARFLTGAGNGHGALFRWYAEEEAGGSGLAFAYDLEEGRIDNPAVHVNVNNAPLGDMGRFFELAAGEGAAMRYVGFESRLPKGWRVWYAGVHPARPGSPVRVDCFVDAPLKRAYASDASLLERDLRACGFTATGPTLRELATPVLESPFDLELQFDVLRDGSLGPTLGISAGFSLVSARSVRGLFGENGPAAALMGAIERKGLADGRWRHVPGASFSKLVNVDGSLLALYCTPTFVKLRMREGKPLDAKAYLQANACSAEVEAFAEQAGIKLDARTYETLAMYAGE